ncbi:MAG: hypothetical protein PHV26_02830, partial [Candidatus Pacebacteria bacterium]|nr:hypothetical protein [Candidatus Paceibacterota bacterium]
MFFKKCYGFFPYPPLVRGVGPDGVEGVLGVEGVGPDGVEGVLGVEGVGPDGVEGVLGVEGVEPDGVEGVLDVDVVLGGIFSRGKIALPAF